MVKLHMYELYLARKASIKPFGKGMRVSNPIGLIQFDVYGPMNMKAHHRATYFITLIDDCSQYRYVYLLPHCCEAVNVFKCFIVEVESQL